MNKTISISYPESLANSLRLNAVDFEREIKIISMIKLFEIGKVSSGTAANVLGVNRVDFLDLLSKYQVSLLGQYDFTDLNEDIANA